MTRLACFFALIALAALVLMVTDMNGSTAIVFSFVGFPALGLAVLLYLIIRWRVGAFRLNARSVDQG